jgi:DNA-binding response OmpR family regulator
VEDNSLRVGGIALDDKSKSVTLDGDPVSLTPLEYSILKLLMENPGKVFSSDEIYQSVWKDTPYGANATVAVHIRHLREKLEIDPANPRYLKVLWGHGYKVEADV